MNRFVMKLAGDEFKEIHTYQLGEILQTKSNGLIDEFISYAKQNGGTLKISYQDEPSIESFDGMDALVKDSLNMLCVAEHIPINEKRMHFTQLLIRSLHALLRHAKRPCKAFQQRFSCRVKLFSKGADEE